MPPPLRTWGDCDQCLSALGGLAISACLPFLGGLSPVPLRTSGNCHKCLSALGGNTTTVFVGNEPLRRNACTKAGRGFVKFACAMSNAASALGDALVAPPWQYSAQNNYPAKHRMHKQTKRPEAALRDVRWPRAFCVTPHFCEIFSGNTPKCEVYH